MTAADSSAGSEVVPTLEIVVGHGSRRLAAKVCRVGEDLVIAVSGGDRPHVGCAVLATPVRRRDGDGFAASSSVLTIPPHREEPIARGVAESVCGRLGRTVLVTAGVHEDGLDRAGIETYLQLGRELAESVVDRLTARG